MSIINEALKKALREKESVPSSSYQEALRKKLEARAQNKRPRITWAPVFIVLVLLLITGPIIAPLFSASFRKSQELPKPAGDTAQSKKGQFGVEQAPLFPSGPISMGLKSGFKLTGIVYSSDGSYCIINNKILKVGDSIQDATLVSVMPNEVLLDHKGRKVSLAL